MATGLPLVGVPLAIWVIVEVAPRPHRVPAIIALVIAVLAGFVAWSTGDLIEGAMTVLCAAMLATAIWLIFFKATAVAGVLVLAGALVLMAVASAVVEVGPSHARPAMTLLVALAGVAFALAILGFFMRQGYQYAADQGAKVVVTLPDQCSETRELRGGGVSTTCENATWNAVGATVRGTLHAGYGELRSGNPRTALTTEPVEAYAVGDDAYTAGYGGPSRFYPFHVLGLWLLIPLPVLLAARRLAGRVTADAGSSRARPVTSR